MEMLRGGERIDRYIIEDEIAAGGMARVHLGRMLGAGDFARTVAIKCMHEHYAKDAELVAMFMDEARLAARIQHPNVVSTLDVVKHGGNVFIVMEYVAGVRDRYNRADRAQRARRPLPAPPLGRWSTLSSRSMSPPSSPRSHTPWAPGSPRTLLR